MKHCRVRIPLGLLLVFALVPPACPQTPSPNEKKVISITWLGHAAFEILSSGGTDLLIDPFLTEEGRSRRLIPVSGRGGDVILN